LFTGREYDPETGLYHYRARGYDASTGRFLQRDPLGFMDGLSLHEYVASQPTTASDPKGTSGTKLDKALDAATAATKRALELHVEKGRAYDAWKKADDAYIAAVLAYLTKQAELERYRRRCRENGRSARDAMDQKLQDELCARHDALMAALAERNSKQQALNAAILDWRAAKQAADSAKDALNKLWSGARNPNGPILAENHPWADKPFNTTGLDWWYDPKRNTWLSKSDKGVEIFAQYRGYHDRIQFKSSETHRPYFSSSMDMVLFYPAPGVVRGPGGGSTWFVILCYGDGNATVCPWEGPLNANHWWPFVKSSHDERWNETVEQVIRETSGQGVGGMYVPDRGG
jgi:RHS repeat-associated protein